jgi:uncharacterized Fe-S cluster-containing radical SAM superfamily protein
MPEIEKPHETAYDPVARAEETAKVVTRADLRKYYRFRLARFYGGIATADCLGCCLRCLFCWSWDNVTNCKSRGEYLSPDQVVRRLTSIARKKDFRQVRISGNEPTIARDHLLSVLRLIPKDLLFILETNGILIGHDRIYAKELAGVENLYVRVSLKGSNNEEFHTLTGARGEGFELQIKGLENLHNAGVDVQPAVMTSFSSSENLSRLRKRLGRISQNFMDFEVEELVLYGDVEERLKKANIPYGLAHEPGCEPPDQV